MARFEVGNVINAIYAISMDSKEITVENLAQELGFRVEQVTEEERNMIEKEIKEFEEYRVNENPV